MEITLHFTTKERYNRAVHHLVNNCKKYRLNSRGKCLDGVNYGYVSFAKKRDYRFLVWCDTCGKEFDLNDPNNCNVYPCDCGKAFCPDCFIKRFGKSDFDSMMDAWESYCPDCWPKYKQEIMSR